MALKRYTSTSGFTFEGTDLSSGTNPFQNKDGSWIDGKEIEWAAWNEAKRQYLLDQMTEAERIEYLENERRFARRIRIEAGG